MVWKDEREGGIRIFEERLEGGKVVKDSEIQAGGWYEGREILGGRGG